MKIYTLTPRQIADILFRQPGRMTAAPFQPAVISDLNEYFEEQAAQTANTGFCELEGLGFTQQQMGVLMVIWLRAAHKAMVPFLKLHLQVNDIEETKIKAVYGNDLKLGFSFTTSDGKNLVTPEFEHAFYEQFVQDLDRFSKETDPSILTAVDHSESTHRSLELVGLN